MADETGADSRCPLSDCGRLVAALAADAPYCSRAHRRRAARADRLSRACAREECEVRFEARGAHHRFCSATCRSAARLEAGGRASVLTHGGLAAAATTSARRAIPAPGSHAGAAAARLTAMARRGPLLLVAFLAAMPGAIAGAGGEGIGHVAWAVRLVVRPLSRPTAMLVRLLASWAAAAWTFTRRRLEPVLTPIATRLSPVTRPVGRAFGRLRSGVERALARIGTPIGRAWSRIPRPVRVPAASLTAVSAVFVLLLAVASANTFTVNDTSDRVDAAVGNGTCDADLGAGGSQCTLRAAIQEANARSGHDIVSILPGTYAIAIAPINENGSNVGDYEILDPVTIEKAMLTWGDVVIDGGTPLPSSPIIARGLDRLFEIHPGAGDVAINNVTLQNGYTPEEGGAIQNWSLGKLTLQGVTVRDSYAEKSGGGLNHADLQDYPWTTEPPNLELLPYGRVEIRSSTFTGNGASEMGGAINNVSGGTITISQNSVITLNPGPIQPDPLDPEEFILVDPADYPLAASAISNEARTGVPGTLRISSSTVSLNASGAPGAGIANWGDGIVTIEGASKLLQNRTAAEGGGLFSEGGKLTIAAAAGGTPEIARNRAANGGGVYSGGHISMFGLRGRFDVSGASFADNIAENGGAIYNDGDGQLFVTDTTFARNLSTDHGAAITSTGRTNMTLTRVAVTDNVSNGEGGGVWTHSERQQTIVDSTFSGNRAGVPMIEDGVLSEDVAGGGGLHTDGGPVTVLGSVFNDNSATDEGGAISIHNLGDVVLRDSVLKNNRAYDGGAIENSATRVTFERMTVQANRAANAGGGVYNTSSGPFEIIDSTIRENVGVIGGGLANAPDNDLIIRGSLFLNNSARIARNDEGVIDEEAGKGGGLMSFADGDSLIENTTFSGNKAAAGGGGLFHDADGELRLVHITVWNNSAPAGGGIGVRESDFVPPIPPAANSAVVMLNSIVGGSVQGGNCDWYVRSEGGNLETGSKNTCFLAVTAETAESPIELGVRDRRGDPKLWAIADNGGPTLTHALQYGSFAIDSSPAPCSIVDQRGTARPQNGKCDAGAFEFVGPPPPVDNMPPETFFTPGIDGPKQDSFETMAFTFRGEDQPDPDNADGGITPPDELNFECRFFEIDLAEQQEPVEPWLPQPPEFMWNGCSSPWTTILFEEGMMNFEVRAIDRAGNIDPTPVKYILNADNMEPPDTRIVEAPGLPDGQTVPPRLSFTPSTNSRSALFSFEGVSAFTPPQWFEYECRLDSNDPEMWLECFNPAMYSNLSTGLHTFEVRAATEVGGFEGDPTPARYTWRVGPDPDAENQAPLTCDEANVTLTASADGWVDQVTPIEGYMFHTELTVRSDANDPGNGQPIVPMNARAFYRFPVTNDAPDCQLVSATLRLYADGHTEDRTIEVVPLAESWKESTLTWVSQPDPYAGVTPALAQSGELYREWDVTDHVEAMLNGDLPAHGWVVRDRHESDTVDGGDQSFHSREMPQVPPFEVTLPELELRFEAAGTPPPPPRSTDFEERGDIACGERITRSTRLTADVTGCMGEGIAFGAPNIILDLNGHTIESGLLLEPGEETGGFPGIRINQPNVEVRGPGVVTNFMTGVLVGPGSIGSLVENVTAFRNGNAGIQVFDADDGRTGNVVRGNRLDSNYGTGVELISNAEGNTVENNAFVQNSTSIHIYGSHRNLIRGNDISGIVLDPTLDSDAGIVIEGGSRDNVLQDNRVADTGDAGVKIHEGSHGTQVIGGIFVRNGDAGVIAELSDRIVVDGIVSHQQSDGGVVIGDSNNSVVKNSDLRYNPSGVQASNTHGLVVDNNDASESLGAGFDLGSGLGMRITNNIANLSGGSGISLEGGMFDAEGLAHGGALVANNTTNENAEAGISIDEPARHTLAGNAAYNNAGYGIEAGSEPTPGEPIDPNANIDGGANRASGNHADLGVAAGEAGLVQCLGVICDTTASLPITPIDLTSPETIIVDGPLGPTPPDPETGSTGSETAVFEFRGEDDTTAATAMIFECRLDAPPDPVEVEEPELEPPDPTDPELPEPPEGLNWVECSSPYTILGIEPGTHVFEVRAHDWAGNFDLTPAVYTWTVHAGVDDQGQNESPAVAPETRITAAPGELSELRNADGEPLLDADGKPIMFTATTNRSATLGFTGSDNLTAGYNLAYQCRRFFDQFDNALTPEDMPSEAVLPFEPCTSLTQYTSLPYGGHLFEVRSIDLAGNRDFTPAWHAWWIQPPPPDTTPPDTEILSGPDPTTVLTTATFDFTGSDNQTPLEQLEFQCRLDGAMEPGSATTPLWQACTSPHVVTVSGSATTVEHVLQVRAVDLAGNVDDVNGTTDDTYTDGVPATYVWTVGAAPVQKTVFCGQKITQSIIVNNNLGDCLGHGLIVGANGITIDLNGKTIDGKSLGAGVLNNGFDSVTIKNGRLIDFDYGVMINQGASLNIVDGVTAERMQDAGVGIGQQTWPEDPNLAPSVPVTGFQSRADGNVVRSSTLVLNRNGVWLMNGAQDNVVRGNLIGSSSGEAVFLDRAVETLVEGNDIQVASKNAVLLEGAIDSTVRGNSISQAGTGILVSATTGVPKGIQSSGAIVQGNLLTDISGPGLEITESNGVELLDNVVTLSDSYAIELYLADDNVIRGNQVSGNKGGISLKNSIGNLIENNDTSDSDSTGIVIASQSLGNIVRGNQSNQNIGGGIYIADETPGGQGTLVEGNTANGNKGMGIQASKPSHIFRNNVAFDNDSWGIHAGDPSNGHSNVDAGGNIAHGNKGPLGLDLKPQQCYNVRCTGGPGGGDQITPSTSLLETPLDPSSESVATFRFTGADNATPVTFECRFGDGAWAPCTSPTTYKELVNGTYTFEVRALDFVGNVDPTPESYIWAVQLGAFQASIDSTPDLITVDTSATFTFSASVETGVTYQCVLRRTDSPDAVDWSTAQACASPKTYADLEPGTYEFHVRATDAHSTYDTKVYTWTVGAPPVEAEVNCGQVLTESTKVMNDLVDCGGYGLIVGAPGITIDLDGHIIDGLGLDAGILNNGHDDVTIRNGMVSQFLIGVQLNPGTGRNVLHGLRVEGNTEAGIALADADEGGEGNTIRDNAITANVAGIALYSGTRDTVIRNNDFAANLGEASILLQFASGNLIEHNQIGQSGASGVYIIGGAGNTITDNRIKDSGSFGINAGDELLVTDDNLVQRNLIQGGAGGIMVGGDGNRVVNNTVTGATGPGVLVELGTNTLVKGNDFTGNASGISVAESTGTVVEANNASGTDGSGIAIEELSSQTIVRNNTVSGNKGDGIEVTESSVVTENRSLIENNTADANGGEGLSIEGAGFDIKGNVAQMNGGWGIYNIGSVDAGGNFAAGNMEEAQCFGVVCQIGTVPGAPDTWIVSGPVDVDTSTPGIQTNSRNISVTYMGADEFTPIEELVFECRIDSTSMAENAWVDCEYPAEFLNLSPGEHTLDIRAVDMLGQGLADPTPASVTWVYVPLPFGVAPDVILDVVPPAETYLFDAVFTFHSNEPDVTFQCKVDLNGWEPCGFEGAAEMNLGAFEWSFEQVETGPHTFYVRAVDFEGNISEPTTYTWTLLGITVVITDGPGFIPPVGGPLGDPAEGGPTMSSSAEIIFEAVPDPGDVTFMCRFDSIDPNGFFPCTSPFRVGPAYAGSTDFPEPLLIGEHMLEVYGESELMGSMAELEAAEYEWEVVESLESVPPETTIERAPGPADLSSTIFEFSGIDDLTPDFLLSYECQVTVGATEPNPSAWEQCFSPFNLLDIYNYGDPEMLLTEKTLWVRAIDVVEPEFVDPTQPDVEGNPDPTPAFHTWTPVADTFDPSVLITGGPADGATVGEEVVPYSFAGSDNATPLLRLQFECAAYLTAATEAAAEWASCDSPIGGGFDISGIEPGAYTVAIRALDMAGNVGPAETRTVTVAAAPVVSIRSGPNGRLDPVSGEPSLPVSTTESSVFTFSADQTDVTFECSLDGAQFVPCNTPSGVEAGLYVHAFWVVDSGTHEVEIRATNAQGLVGLETLYEWVVELGPDAAAPSTFLLSGPENGTLDTVATFTFTGSDNRTPAANLSFECGLDTTTAWNSCVSPQQFSDLVRGTHTLNVRAIDATGNVDPTPAAYTWIVAPPPVVAITAGPGVELEESTSTTATFEFVSDVPGSTFECWLDGRFNPSSPANPLLPGTCASGVTYHDLGFGPHLFAVRAIDSFGNIGVWEDVEFDIIPPQAVLTSVPANGTSTTATFAFTTDPVDPDATFYCSLDGRPFGLCESPKTYTNLFGGQHEFEVQTVYTGLDWMGFPLQFDPVPVRHTWTVVDLTAPDTIIEFGPPASTLSTSAYIQVTSNDPMATIECVLDGPNGSATMDCELGTITELTDLVPGTYTLTATASDEVGNVDATPATHSWTIGVPSGAPNTPVGDNVAVTVGNVTVTFFAVETSGLTTVDTLGAGPALPDGYSGGGGIFDISTTAAFSEPVIVCVTYDEAAFATTSLRLLHFDGELWLDITTLHNPHTNRICGEAESFSLFAVAAASSGSMPETSILSGPTGPLNAEGIPTSTRGSATFEFWADQPNAITQCSIDGEPYVGCESPYTVGPLEAGEHEFWVQAVNDFGWVDLTPAIYEWEVLGPDTTPPTTSITRGPPDGSSTPNYISWFEFSGSDDFTPLLEMEFQCTLDGVDLGGCETPEEIEVLEAGPHTLFVQAIDAAGNIDPVGVTRNWTVVDMSFPDTEIILGPEEETTETTATFEFEGFEELTGLPVNEFECALDEGDFAPCTSPWTITGVTSDAHVFLVRAVDPEGNRDISPDFYEWLVLGGSDTTPPETFIVFSPEAANSGPDVVFGFAANEPVEVFECAWGAGTPPAAPTTWEDCEAVFELQGLPSGLHWLWVRGTDVALNVDQTPAPGNEPFVWTVNGEPDTIITRAPADPSAEFTATFEFESDQAGATFECAIDGLEFTPCTSPYLAGPFMPDVDGGPMDHEFEVRAVNQYLDANNELVMDASPAIHEWMVQDATPPTTTFLGAEEIGPPEQLDLEPGLRFSFRADDDWASVFELMFECGLDNTEDAEPVVWADCTEPGENDTYFFDVAYADLAAGTYTFQVRAMDIAENVDATPAPVPPYTFTIDGEPETVITSVTPDVEATSLETTSRSVTFTFSGGASYLCRLGDESAPFVECPGGVVGQATYTDLPYGEHVFQVMALGASGTPDSSPAEFTWMIGTDVAPDVTITASPVDGGTATSGTIEFGSTDPQAAFLCTLDAAPEQPCSSPFTYSDLLAGEQNPHTFTVVATLPHLLESVVPNEMMVEWLIADEAAPETTLQPLLADPTGTEVSFAFVGTDNGGVANLEFECRLDGIDPWVGCDSPYTVSSLTGGLHTFEVRATDLVPLTDESPASHTWTVIAPPMTTITNTDSFGATVEPGATSTVATGQLAFFDQPGSSYECRLDAVDPDVDPFTPCVSPYPYDLSNGTHTFEVRATTALLDNQTMLESPAAEFAWTIDAPDSTDPDTLIQLAPADGTTSTSATFLFTGTDNLTAPIDLTFECSLDGAAFSNCSSGDVYSALGVGDHDFAVRAIDGSPLENTDTTPATWQWTIVAAGASNTPTGTSVTVALGDATVSFEQVTASGVTEVSLLTAGASAPSLPAGYAGASYYDVSTTATFVGNVTVCLPSGSVTDARVLHFEGEWIDLSTGLQGDRACAVVGSLSPFAVAQASAGVAPETTIVQAPSDPTIQSTAVGAEVLIQFTSSIDTLERPASFECKLDAEEWTSCDSPYLEEILFGEHILLVRAVTDTGLIDVSPASVAWTVLERPVAAITDGPTDEDPATPDIENESSTVEFAFESDQAGSTFECQLIGEDTGHPWEACASPQSYGNLVLGEYTFEVRAIKDGNASFLPAQYEWEVADLTVPTVSIDAGPSGTLDAKTATFAFSASEPVIFECSLDDAPFTVCTSGLEYTGLDLGPHTFSVQATDLSENENLSQPLTRTWTVADQTAPTVAIGQKPALMTADTSASFTFTATDNWAGALSYACSLDGAPFSACSSPTAYSGLGDGQHTFEVRVTDAAGNPRTASHSWTVIDDQAAVAEITNVTSGSLIIEFTGTDNHTAPANLRFECRLDGEAYAGCSSPKTYTTAQLSAMPPGGHTFQVRAVDEAGNVGQPDSHAFTVADTTAPNTSITGQPQATTTNADASFTFTGSDDGTATAGLLFQCSLDGGAWAGCTSPKTYSGLSASSHTFSVRATDAAGNTDGTPATYSWTVEAPAPVPDATAPETTIGTNPPATTTETSASFSFAGTDNETPSTGLTFECQLDSGAWSSCSSPKTHDGLTIGAHTFRVRATDAAGNTDASAASYSWTVQSATVDCGPERTLTANADAWIDSGSTTSNKGTDSVLKVMSKSGGNLRALVRFDLPELPDGCSVESATLRMYAASAKTGRTIEVTRLAGAWSEGAVTWANQPTTSGDPVAAASAAGYLEWDVASLVQSMYDTTNEGFLVRDGAENQDAEQQFNSREKSENRPLLVITLGSGTQPAPPPGSTDANAPQTTISGSPGSASPSTSATFTFAGTDDVTTAGNLLFECQLDVPETDPWSACTSPKAYSALGVGTHTFRVRARDESNKVDGSPAVHTWTIDQTAPETIITGGPTATTTDTSASFAFHSPETGTTFECSLDSGAWTACTSPKAYTALAVGTHAFQVRAVDAAGNRDATPGNYPWSIQAGAPVNCGPAQTLSANADSWIDQGSTGSNKGTDSILKVMSKSGSKALRALVRFGLPPIPSGCVVDTASLRLYAGSARTGRTLQALMVNGTWTETGVTWQNQPPTMGSAATVASGSGYRQWNVASIVQTMYSTGTSHGFLIRDANEGQDAEQQFYSREKGEQPPQLVLTFKPASSAAAPGVPPTALTSCVDRCTASAGAIAFQPAMIEHAALVGTLMTLMLALAYIGMMLGRRSTHPPLTS